LFEAQKIKGELELDKRAIENTSALLRTESAGYPIPFAPDEFLEQIDRLLRELRQHQETYARVRRDVAKLQSRRAVLIEEIEILSGVLGELDQDFAFLADSDASQLICPTCNTVHESNFASRFSIISDAQFCRDLLIITQEKLTAVDGELDAQLRQLREREKGIRRAEKAFEADSSELTLHNMLKNESERMLLAAVETQHRSVDTKIRDWTFKESRAVDDMGISIDQAERGKILKYYGEKLEQFSGELEVKFGKNAYQNLHSKMNFTGSYGARAFLAYNYAILHTIDKFSKSCICPIVLDTPLLKDPDSSNSENIIRFIIQNRPSKMQLIIGTVSMHGYEYNGYSINANVKDSFLSKDLYEEVRAYMTPFITKMLGGYQMNLI
jgi:hypothetical protein